jgi:hypothetical protein
VTSNGRKCVFNLDAIAGPRTAAGNETFAAAAGGEGGGGEDEHLKWVEGERPFWWGGFVSFGRGSRKGG